MRARHAKLRRFARTLPRGKGRLQRIVAAGMLPDVAYGARVHGVTDAEWRAASRHLSAFAPPIGACSASAKRVVYGDGACFMAVAPILAWHDELWRTISAAPGPALRPGVLAEIWHAVQPMKVLKGVLPKVLLPMLLLS